MVGGPGVPGSGALAADPALRGVGSDSSCSCAIVAGVVSSWSAPSVSLVVGCESMLFAPGLLVGEGAAHDARSLDTHGIRCRHRSRSSVALVPGCVLAIVVAGAMRSLPQCQQWRPHPSIWIAWSEQVRQTYRMGGSADSGACTEGVGWLT